MADNTLTQEYLKTIFDYKDGLLYRKVTFNKIPPGFVGSKEKKGYLSVSINCKRYKVHRIIWFLHHNYWPKQIDHINGIKNDNRIENLREATTSQNNQNAKIRKDNKSGVKGVSWNTSKQRWFVKIDVDGKRIQIGYFKDLEIAKLAITKARNKYHGNFANHS